MKDNNVKLFADPKKKCPNSNVRHRKSGARIALHFYFMLEEPYLLMVMAN